jgi:hypothetical protein
MISRTKVVMMMEQMLTAPKVQTQAHAEIVLVSLAKPTSSCLHSRNNGVFGSIFMASSDVLSSGLVSL